MQKIKVEILINANIEKVWKCWNDTESIKDWAFASDTWECQYAENDLKIGGKFLTRMSAKDGSESFDFTGTYIDIVEFKKIHYMMSTEKHDNKGRECQVYFEDLGNGATKVTEEFDSEEINSEELQKGGWQAILENFKKYVEAD